MPNEIGADDRVLVYFAGHGIALDGEDGPQGYLVPQDANREDQSSLLSMIEVNDSLAKLPCRHLLLILDCCFAGAFRWASYRDLSPLPKEVFRERYDRYIQDPAWQVLTSAAHDQTALDVLYGDTIGERVETGKHSPFATALFQALQGEADLIPRGKDGQPGGNGVITATELYLYLRERMETATIKQAKRQTPGLWPLKNHDKGEFILLTPGRELSLRPAPALNSDNNPYRGLDSYVKGDSDLFFGRDDVIDELRSLVAENPLTVVLGASGTGKSSVVKAGLLSQLSDFRDGSEVALWNVGGGKVLEWKHDNSVSGAMLSSDESQLLSWTGGDRFAGRSAVRLWNASESSNGPLKTWIHADAVIGAVFDSDDSHVLAWSRDGAVKLYSVTRDEPLRVWQHVRGVRGARFLGGGSRVLAWTGAEDFSDGCVKLWDTANRESSVPPVTRAEPVFSRDNSHYLVANGVTLELRRVEGNVLLQAWKHDHDPKMVLNSVFSEDGKQVLSWCRTPASMRLWDVSKSTSIKTWNQSVENAIFDRDGKQVVTWTSSLSGEGGRLQLWQIPAGDQVKTWNYKSRVRGAVFSSDGSCVLGWSQDELKLWEVENPEKPLQEWKHGGKKRRGVIGARFSFDESRVLSWTSEFDGPSSVRLWDVRKEKWLQEWELEKSIEGAAFLHDDSRVVTWSSGTVAVWDVFQKKAIRVWERGGHVHGAVHADDSRFLTWSRDGAIILYDLTKAELTQSWEHEEVVGATFSPDKSRVLSWSSSQEHPFGALTLWDVTKSEPLCVRRLDDQVRHAVFSPTGSRVIAWTEAGVMRLDVESDDLTPAERLLELEVRSATRLDSVGRLIPLRSEQWIQLLRSPEYTRLRVKAARER